MDPAGEKPSRGRTFGRYQGRRRYQVPHSTTAAPDPLSFGLGALLLLAVSVAVLLAMVLVKGFAPGSPEQASSAAEEATEHSRAGAAAARGGPSVRTSAVGSGANATSAAPGTSTTPRPDPSPTEAPVPAIPPTMSPPPSPSPTTDSYEAEADRNTFGPGLQVRSLDAASGNRYVANIGTASLRFNAVTAVNGGDYTMTVYYLGTGARSAWLKVNDGPAQVLTFGRADDGAIGTLTMTVGLVVGTNTIELGGQPTGPRAPDLDRITIRSAG
jgi:hypothetical protein